MTDSDKFKDAYHEALEAANRAEAAEAGKHEEVLKRAELVFDAEPEEKAPAVRRKPAVAADDQSPAVRAKKPAVSADDQSDQSPPARSRKPPVPPPKKKKLPVPVVKAKEENDDDDDDDDDDEEDDDHDREVSRFGGQYLDASTGFLQDYISEVKAILFKPYDYFKSMPAKGGLVPPTLFLTVTAGIFAVLHAIFTLKIEAGIFGALLQAFMAIFFGFFGAFVQAFIASGIIFLALQQMKGKGTFEGTFRVIVYGKATLLFAWIPWIGLPGTNIMLFGVLAIAYGVYLNILGLERLHRLPRKLVTLLVAIIALIGFIMKLNMGGGA